MIERLQAEKRKAKKALATPPPSAPSETQSEVGKPTKKRKRDEDEPPAWVGKFVESVIAEKSKANGEKKPAKQIREEAKTAAKEQWQNGFTKDRITNEVDNHMNRLYGMIFSRK